MKTTATDLFERIAEMEEHTEFQQTSILIRQMADLLRWYHKKRMVTDRTFNRIAGQINRTIDAVHKLIEYNAYVESETTGMALMIEKCDGLIDPEFARYLAERFNTDVMLAATSFRIEQMIAQQLQDLKRKQSKWDRQVNEILTKKNICHAN